MAARLGVVPRTTKEQKLTAEDANRMAGALAGQVIRESSPAALNKTLLSRIPPTARVVLIGEATHGTRDMYAQRAELTQLLIEERGFHAVLCEADFPDMWRVNEYVKGMGRDSTARDALGSFTRFPLWMWRNKTVVRFVEWLKQYNEQQGAVAAEYVVHGGVAAGERAGSGVAPAPAGSVEPEGGESPEEAALRRKVGIYGMDVYSMHASAAAAVAALREHDPELASEVEARYKCLDKYGGDSQSYGLAVGRFRQPSCEQAVKAALKAMRVGLDSLKRQDGSRQLEETLQMEANAMVVRGAEQYYRAMFYGAGRDETWNLRDAHFCEVVQLVERHVARMVHGTQAPRLVVWAHNSHLGDARATDMSWRRKEHNVGQLLREVFPPGTVYSIGFTTHTGTVAAAEDWGEPVRIQRVRPSLQGSIEDVLHRVSQATGSGHFALEVAKGAPQAVLQDVLLERAIGVVYRPQTELYSHYFYAFVPGQFDLVIHMDSSHAVAPLDAHRAGVDEGETWGDLPETYPEAL